MWINNIAELPWKYTLYTPELSCRKVLEMCCFMQNFLARTLADFEMNLEKEVLVPLNKLSEVVFVLVPNYMNWNRLYSWPIHDRCYPYRRTCQRSWKTRNSLLNLQQTGIMHASGDFVLFCLVILTKICFNFSFNVNHTFVSLRSSFMKIVSWTFMQSVSHF